MKSKNFLKCFATLFIFAFIMVRVASAQTIKTDFTVGFNHHTVSVADDGGALQPGSGLAETYGVSLMVMENSWIVKTGLHLHNLPSAYYFRTGEGTAGKGEFSDSFSTYRIPFMVGKELALTNAISITPQAGFLWLSDRSTDTTRTSAGSFTENSLTIDYETISRTVNKNKFLAEVGMD